MEQQELFGRLSLVDEDGSPPKLLLDGIPIADGQIVAAKHGESEYLRGRIRLHSKGYWILDHSEFIGHTYVNVPLKGQWLDNLTVVLEE